MSVTKRYFLAANGFSGFRSRFDSMLSNKSINKLYIIKGGSGVGKSTLMRSVSAHFADSGYCVEEIPCSSDPASLDGVVIKSECGDVVLIDGTSPHEYDMRYPMARDHIVDLSKHLDENALKSKKEEIVSLVEKKKKAYENAYKYLHLAGECYKILHNVIDRYINDEQLEQLAESLFGKRICDKCEVESHLYSSFSKSGIVTLDTAADKCERTYYFESGYKAQALFSRLATKISKRAGSIELFSSPFSDDIIDGFCVNNEAVFKSSDLLPTYKPECYIDDMEENDLSSLRESEKMLELAISAAKDALAQASVSHFALEEIYGEAMDFEKNTRLCKKLIEKIASEV